MMPRRVRDEAPVSFLSRLGSKRPDSELSDEARFEREVVAITRNLGAVLNSRKGTSSVVSDFGLGDYEGESAPGGAPRPHLATKEVLAVLVPELAAQVARYEPRIADPRVEVLGRDRKLYALFEVTGSVAGRPARFRLALHTVYRNVLVEADTGGPDRG